MRKIKVSLDDAEWRVVIYAMNELRNSLIADGRYTDIVDEVLLKIIKLSDKNVKIA